MEGWCVLSCVMFMLQSYRYNSSSLCSRLKIILYLVFQIIRVPHSISHWGTPMGYPSFSSDPHVTHVTPTSFRKKVYILFYKKAVLRVLRVVNQHKMSYLLFTNRCYVCVTCVLRVCYVCVTCAADTY